MKTAAFLALSVFAMASADAQSDAARVSGSERAPWQWSVEERLAVRFDPGVVQQSRERRSSSALVRKDESVPVNGADRPELLLPFELVNDFLPVLRVPAERRQAVRERFRPFIETGKWNFDEFWRQVEQAATPYFAAHDHAVARLKDSALPEPERKANSQSVCVARAAALQKLRTSLGAVEFDRFLYTAVAPNMQSISMRGTTPDMLRRIEGGCR
jgi:hypothetical protein